MREENHDVGFDAKNNRCEDDNSCSSAGNDGEAYFMHTFHGGLERVLLVFVAVSKNTLGHDNGVVDKHPNGKHQAHH